MMPKKTSKRKTSKKKLVKNKKPAKIDFRKQRVLTGIKGFDNLMRFGIPRGSSVLVEGGPGSGKTIFCLQTGINACKRGENVLYMSFEEHPERLINHMESFGWNPKKYIKNKKLKIERFNALDIARSVEALLSEAKHELLIEVKPMFFPKNFKPDIVLIDSLSSIASAFSGSQSRFRIYMEQLFRYLENVGITSFLVRETGQPSHVGLEVNSSNSPISFLSDGIIAIYNAVYPTGQRQHAIEIVKMRGESFTKRIMKMDILDKKGIIIHNKSPNGNYRLT